MFLATGHGSVLQSANCDLTYSGDYLGYWNIECITAGRPPQNASRRSCCTARNSPASCTSSRRTRATSRSPTSRPARRRSTTSKTTSRARRSSPLARVGRVWGFFRVRQEVEFRHLLRTAWALAVVGGHVDVLRTRRAVALRAGVDAQAPHPDLAHDRHRRDGHRRPRRSRSASPATAWGPT